METQFPNSPFVARSRNDSSFHLQETTAHPDVCCNGDGGRKKGALCCRPRAKATTGGEAGSFSARPRCNCIGWLQARAVDQPGEDAPDERDGKIFPK